MARPDTGLDAQVQVRVIYVYGVHLGDETRTSSKYRSTLTFAGLCPNGEYIEEEHRIRRVPPW